MRTKVLSIIFGLAVVSSIAGLHAHAQHDRSEQLTGHSVSICAIGVQKNQPWVAHAQRDRSERLIGHSVLIGAIDVQKNQPLVAQDKPPKPDVDPLKDDLKSVQGQWTRKVLDRKGKQIGTVIKVIRGKKERVTHLDADGKVQQAHAVEIDLRRSGAVRVFTYSKFEFIKGPDEGKKLKGRGGYIYKVEGNRFLEVHGLLISQEKEPTRVLVWEKVNEREA